MASHDTRRVNPGAQVDKLYVGAATKVNPHLVDDTSVPSPVGLMTPRTITGIDFNGSDEYLTLATDSDFDFDYNDAFSISAWLNWTNTSQDTIISKMVSGGTYRGWALDVKSRKPHFYLINTWSSHTLYVNAETGVVPGSFPPRWSNVIVTYDGSTNASGVTFYADGMDLGALTVTYNSLDSGESTTNSTAVLIGQRTSAGYFDGNISNVSVWNKELSAAEAIDVWNYGILPDLNSHSAAANLVAWWKCGTGDNGAGTPDSTDSDDAASRIYDMSSNSHNMTPVNMDDDEIKSVVG